MFWFLKHFKRLLDITKLLIFFNSFQNWSTDASMHKFCACFFPLLKFDERQCPFFQFWLRGWDIDILALQKNILIYVTVRGSPKAVKLFGVILCVYSFFTTKHYSTHGTHQFYYYMKKTQTRKTYDNIKLQKFWTSFICFCWSITMHWNLCLIEHEYIFTEIYI